jgi:hypothetical protein
MDVYPKIEVFDPFAGEDRLYPPTVPPAPTTAG